MTLFKVVLAGYIGSGTNYKTWYVLAPDPTTAAKMVQEKVGPGGWTKDGLGFDSDRQLHNIEVIAAEYEYTTAPAHVIASRVQYAINSQRHDPAIFSFGPFSKISDALNCSPALDSILYEITESGKMMAIGAYILGVETGLPYWKIIKGI